MRSEAMDEPVETKAANAQFPHARPDVPSRVPYRVKRAMRRTERRYRKRGGLWVGGHVHLTSSELSFEPNEMNRQLNSGRIEFRIPLNEITSIETKSAFMTSIVEVHAGRGQRARFRCYGARQFAERIRAQLDR